MEQTSTTTETPTSTVGDARASLAAADSSSATPETSSAQTPAAAGTPPAETPVVVTSTDPVDDPRSPFIPRARFDEVNTQKGQLADQLKQYEWAKDYRPEDVQSVASWTRAFARDPVSAVLHAIQTIEANPQHAQALRSHFARTLGARRPSEPVAEPEPEPDLQAADGTLVYSAPAQKAWREWNIRQLTAALTKSFEEKLQPLQRVAQTFQQRESATQADHEASNAIAAFASDPDFTPENRTACREVIAADQRLQALADVDPKAANACSR